MHTDASENLFFFQAAKYKLLKGVIWGEGWMGGITKNRDIFQLSPCLRPAQSYLNYFQHIVTSQTIFLASPNLSHPVFAAPWKWKLKVGILIFKVVHPHVVQSEQHISPLTK